MVVEFWAFEDRPISWDAWDIDPFYEDRPEKVSGVTSITVTETGPLRAAVRVERRFRSSTIVQDIRLTDRSAALEFATEVDWHETHTLLKVAFPMSANAPNATYDIQWGHIDRPTSRDSRKDASRFEVCGHKWAALNDGGYGCAILNDCKYGHDTLGNVIRLTLIKSSTMPDPEADQGLHEFTYALMGAHGPTFEAIRAEAEALNHPVLLAPGLDRLPTLVQTDASNVIVQTVKPSEDGRGFVVRLYESEGRETDCRLAYANKPAAIAETDLLERDGDAIDLDEKIQFNPFQIRSFRILPKAIQ